MQEIACFLKKRIDKMHGLYYNSCINHTRKATEAIFCRKTCIFEGRNLQKNERILRRNST